jgi:hypothetical protein
MLWFVTRPDLFILVRIYLRSVSNTGLVARHVSLERSQAYLQKLAQINRLRQWSRSRGRSHTTDGSGCPLSFLHVSVAPVPLTRYGYDSRYKSPRVE